MSEVQFLIILICGLAILIVVLLIALFCKDKPCTGLHRIVPWAVDLLRPGGGTRR